MEKRRAARSGSGSLTACRTGVWAVTAMVAAVSGCGVLKEDQPQQSELLTAGTVNLSIPLPPGSSMSSVVLASSSSMLLGNNVKVSEDGVSTGRPMIANTGTGLLSTQTGVNDLTADIWSVGSVSLATSTNVAGSLTTGGTLTKQTGVTIGGTVTQHQSLAAVPTTISVTFPSSSTDAILNPGQNSAIAPGGYSTVTVNSNATLTLQSGTYYIDALDIEPQGKIALTGAGPFVLNVRSSLNLKGQIVLPTSAVPPAFVLVDAGTSDVFLQAEFDGTLIAPNANITLANIGSSATYHGAYFGKGLTLQAGVRISHRATTLGSVSPIAECIITTSPGNYQAVFGYSASSLLGSVTIPLGTDNAFSPAPATRGQPQTFLAGRHTAQFVVPFTGTALTWQLDGRSSTATALLPECTTACVQHLATPPKSRIDTVLSTAAAPLSIDESIVQRDAFRWDDTLPVPETFSDGTPRLYYGLFYVDSPAAVDALDALRIHYDNVPVFDQEIQTLRAGGATSLSYPMDGRGQFAFGLIPGAGYNALRAKALDPTQPAEIFRAVQLRPIPATDSQLAAQTSCGLTPVASCVAHAAKGSLRAVFSYNNPSGGPVTVPAGPDNVITGGPAGTLPPEAFANGSHTAVFAVNMAAGATVTWQLAGQTVSLNPQSATCTTAVVNAIGVDQYKPFPAPATATCRLETPAEAQYPTSKLPPAARVNTCASVSYQYAGTLGFQWRGVATDADDTRGQAADALLALADSLPAGTPQASTVARDSSPDGVQGRQSALFGKLFRKIVQSVAGTVKSAVDGVRRGLTGVAGLFVGSTNVTITANVLNTDSSMNPGGTVTPVLQAWGAKFGKAISLQGVQTRAKRSLFLSVGNLDGSNNASVKVLNRLGADICFNLSNGAAKVVDGWFLPITVCPGDSSAHISGSPPSTRTVNVADGNVNIMAQMTDVSLYMSKVGHTSLHQAEALVGTVPNLIGKLNQNRAFTPCLSFSWSNDVGALLASIGAVAADHLDEYVVSQIESGARAVEAGVKSQILPQLQAALNDANNIASQVAGTNLAADANAAVNAVQAALNQAQAAANQATLFAQDANDLTNATGVAARLEAGAVARANAAATSVQTAVTNVTGGVPVLNTAVQAVATPVQNAAGALTTLANDLVGSPATLLNPIAEARALTTNAGAALSNLASQVATLTVNAQRVGVDTAAGVIGFALGETIGSIFEFFAGGDILFPAAKGDSSNLTSRGVATHEYGHYTLCNLLNNVNPAQFAVAYDEAAAQGLVTGQDPAATSAVLNESFADLIASQVAGGTNYALTANSLSGGGLNYCQASDMSCIETNTVNVPNSTFPNEVLRDVSMYTDVFDSHTVPSPLADVPSNGNEWAGVSGAISLAAAPGAAGTDELVTLTGSAYGAWMQHALARGPLLREDNVFGGLSDAMADQGVNWCERCHVFSLHTVDGTLTPICPTQWVGPRPTVNGTPLSCTFEGCPAGTTADPSSEICMPACPVNQHFDVGTLTCVPDNIIG